MTPVGFHYSLAVIILLVLSLYLELFNNNLRAGNHCLLHPFSLVLKPRQGGGIGIPLDLVNLAKDVTPATRMCDYTCLKVQA